MEAKRQRPGLAGTGATEYQTADAAILRFPSRKFTRACVGCQIPFKPLHSWHRLCRPCWAGHVAITATLRARDALRELIK
jgi:hypothetical protein